MKVFEAIISVTLELASGHVILLIPVGYCSFFGVSTGAAEKHGLSIGDHCISEQIVPCWACRCCKRGAYHMCMPHDIYGFHQKTPGKLSKYWPLSLFYLPFSPDNPLSLHLFPSMFLSPSPSYSFCLSVFLSLYLLLALLTWYKLGEISELSSAFPQFLFACPFG